MTAILGFLFAGLTIRWLGEAEAGFAIAVSTIVGINNTFSGLGLGTAATRKISRAHADRNWQEIKDVAGVCLTTSLMFGVAGFLILAFGSGFILEWSHYKGNTVVGRLYCILLGSSFLLQQISNYFNIFLISLQRFDWQTKLNTLFGLANGIFGITLLKTFPSILTLGAISLSLALINCLCTGIVVRRILGFLSRPSWSQPIFNDLWSFGKWVYMTQIKVIFFDGVDKLFLTSVFGSSSLPFYAFAQRIYLTAHGMLVGQSSYLFPMLSAQGERMESVAGQIEDRLRWLIGLLSALIYAGLIIAGPALLTLIINGDFSRKASFQLFVFSWVGYIHAQAIITYFFNFSKGNAKENWVYVMITGFGYLPVFVLLSLLFGFQYAVLGQLMMLWGVIYLLHNAHGGMGWIRFAKWAIKPLLSSLLLMIVSTIIHFLLVSTNSSITIQAIALITFYGAGIATVYALERNFFGGKHRIQTIARAVRIMGQRLNQKKN
jgi:O-antigen/teichoic acid export membrane protein